MKVFSHPLRLDGSGSIATVDQGSVRHAQELGIAIVSTFIGERPLAPDFGIFDPVAVGTSEGEIRAAVDLCEPDLTVTGVEITRRGDHQRVDVTVQWDTTTDEETI